MDTRAAIDIGTNSVKLLVAKAAAAGFETIEDRLIVTRLGEGLQASGSIGEAAAARTLEALRTLLAAARAGGARDVVVAGTMGLR
ncbi:MAG: Ppx/GppA family phosphatase, partial [Candidatus Eisenbacteria bacterium]